MKKLVLLIGGIVLALIVILIAYTIHGRNIRQIELENALTSSMEKAMDMLQAEKGYAPEDNEEFIAMFLQAFTLQVESSSELTVHILDADYEKGLLSVEAVLKFKHPIGSEGTVSCTRTIVLEQFGAAELENVTIRYMANGSIFKAYTVQQGTAYMDPGIPKLPGKVFAGWQDAEGVEADINGMTAEEDADYFAVFE